VPASLAAATALADERAVKEVAAAVAKELAVYYGVPWSPDGHG